jgi:hypothetical protein
MRLAQGFSPGFHSGNTRALKVAPEDYVALWDCLVPRIAPTTFGASRKLKKPGLKPRALVLPTDSARQTTNPVTQKLFLRIKGVDGIRVRVSPLIVEIG